MQKPIISQNIRMRAEFSIGDNSIIDDYSYFSTKLKIGKNCHIASNCTIGGGKDYTFTLGDYSSISSGCRIWCVSSDFVNDLCIITPKDFDIGDTPLKGNVTFDRFTALGSNSVVMPNNHIPEGTVIGSMSFVPPNFKFESWSVYAGIPIRFIKKRNKKRILRQFEVLENAKV